MIFYHDTYVLVLYGNLIPQKRHGSHAVARLGHNFVWHMIYLPISPQGKPQLEFSYRGNIQQQSNSKLYLQKYRYVPNSPVELVHCSRPKTAWISVLLGD